MVRTVRSGDGSEVGGDFYDLFPTGGGEWAVVLGDVCGKGAEAAVLTALARHTIRVAAMHGVGPSAVLTDVRGAFLRYHPEKFCTALYVALEPSTDGVRLNIASGGHSLPILRRDDGRSEELGRRGPLLGMLELDPSPEATAVLSPGDVLVLSTDGVSEARRAPVTSSVRNVCRRRSTGSSRATRSPSPTGSSNAPSSSKGAPPATTWPSSCCGRADDDPVWSALLMGIGS